MVKSIQAECYKAFHRPYFFIFTLVCALLSLAVCGCLLWIKLEAPGSTPIYLPFAQTVLIFGMPMGLYMVALGCDIVFSEQYKHNTLKNEVSYGIPRTASYLSRLLVSALVLAIVLLVLLAVYLLSAWLFLGLPDQQTAQQLYGAPSATAALVTSLAVLGSFLLSSLPLWLGALGLMTACFFLIRSSNQAAILFVLFIAALPMLLDKLGTYVHPFFSFLYRLTLNYPMDLMMSSSQISWSLMGQCAITGLCWLAVTTAVGLIGFLRSEIR